MKRKALLIGNTSGLSGVQVDLDRFTAFLKSKPGGGWYDSEIDVHRNERKTSLLQKIDTLKRQSFDYLVVMFSGHGGQLRETVLEINGQGEAIEESVLRQIAARQLNVYDCCRARLVISTESRMDSVSASFAEPVNQSRQRYEERIMRAIPQQALLYSCSIGQVSYDRPDGGIYLTNLLRAAGNLANDESFKLVGLAHQEAVAPTIESSRTEKNGVQVPCATLPKCLSQQQLVISMKV